MKRGSRNTIIIIIIIVIIIIIIIIIISVTILSFVISLTTLWAGLTLTFTVAGGHNVSGKENPLASFSRKRFD